MDYNSNRPTKRDDGDKSSTILGGLITVNESTARVANIAESYLKPYALQWFERNGKPQIKAFVETQFKANPTTAGKIASVVSGGLTYGSIFYGELLGLYHSGQNYFSGRTKLAQEVAPVLLAGNHSTGMAGLYSAEVRQNEVIQVARKRLDERVFYDTMADLSQLPSSLAALFLSSHQNETPQQTQERLRREAEAARHATHQLARGPEGGINPLQLDKSSLTMLGTSLLSEGLKDTAAKKGREVKTKKCSLDMISHLAKQVDQNPGTDTIDTPGGREGVEIKKYIKDIFNQHQRDMGQPEIGKRNMERLDYACEEIARAIQAGKLHPKALVNLVGERKIVKALDKSNPDHIEISSRSDIDKALLEQTRRMPAKFSIDTDDFFAQSPLTEDDVKSLLGTLKDKERDFFITLMPTEIVRKAGLSEKEDNEARQRIHQDFGKMLRTALLDIAASDDKELKDAGFSRDDISNMRKWADKARENPQTSLVAAVSTHGQFRKGIDFVLGGYADYWKGIAAKEYAPGELFKKQKSGRAEARDEDAGTHRTLREDDAPASHKSWLRETGEGRGDRRPIRAEIPEAPRRGRGVREDDDERFAEQDMPARHLMRGHTRHHQGRMQERDLGFNDHAF
jgi:hypothetical protein